MRKSVGMVTTILAVAFTHAAAAQGSGISIRTHPAEPLIEWDSEGQYLNFDFAIESTADTARDLERIDLTVLDRAGRVVRQQFVWSKGAASPALRGADLTLPAKGKLSVFNPFFAWPASLPLGTLRYRFVFAMTGLEPTIAVSHDVSPRRYRYPVGIAPPVDGPALVYDGHDFYSHHRRIPLGSEVITKAGLTANPVRFANDFTAVGPHGELARGPLAEPKNWYGYGATVRAVAGGEVVAAAGDVPDNRIEGGELALPEGFDKLDNLRQSLGNHVIIKQPGGLYSILAHLKSGSVSVAVGDRVRQGQVVGAIGFSGDTGFHVHVHHMVTTELTLNTEGVPVRYDRVRRIALPRGGTVAPARNGVRLDTGDLFEVVRR